MRNAVQLEDEALFVRLQSEEYFIDWTISPDGKEYRHMDYAVPTYWVQSHTPVQVNWITPGEVILAGPYFTSMSSLCEASQKVIKEHYPKMFI